jgi:hypothetical protein
MENSSGISYGNLYRELLRVISNSSFIFHSDNITDATIFVSNGRFENVSFLGSEIYVNNSSQFLGHTIIENSTVHSMLRMLGSVEAKGNVFVGGGLEIIKEYNESASSAGNVGVYVVEKNKFIQSPLAIKMVNVQRGALTPSTVVNRYMEIYDGGRGIGARDYVVRSYTFFLNETPLDAVLYVKATKPIKVSINGKEIVHWKEEAKVDVKRYVGKGSSLILVTMDVRRRHLFDSRTGKLLILQVNVTESSSKISDNSFKDVGRAIEAMNSSVVLINNNISSTNAYATMIFINHGSLFALSNLFSGPFYALEACCSSVTLITNILKNATISLHNTSLTANYNYFFGNPKAIGRSSLRVESGDAEVKENFFLDGWVGLDIVRVNRAYIFWNAFVGPFEGLRITGEPSANVLATNNAFVGNYYGAYLMGAKPSLTNNKFVDANVSIMINYLPNNERAMDFSNNTFYGGGLALGGMIGNHKVVMDNIFAGGKEVEVEDGDVLDELIYAKNNEIKVGRGSPLYDVEFEYINSTRFGSAQDVVGDLLVAKVVYHSYIPGKVRLVLENSNGEVLYRSPDEWFLGGYGEKIYTVNLAHYDDGAYILRAVLNPMLMTSHPIYAERRLFVVGSNVQLKEIHITPAKRIYSLYNREKDAIVHVSVENKGNCDGYAHIVVELPSNMAKVGNRITRTIYLKPYETRTLDIPVALTHYTTSRGWVPSDPKVFPDNKKLPATLSIYTFPGYVLVNKTAINIPFTLGPIIHINLLEPQVWPKTSSNNPFDGDGDNILESGENFHYMVSISNIGDEPITIKHFIGYELIHCDSKKYWPNSKQRDYIINYFDYMQGDSPNSCIFTEEYGAYCDPLRLFRTLYPLNGREVDVNVGSNYVIKWDGAYMGHWPTNRGKLSPLDYAGQMDMFVGVEGSGSDGGDITTMAINRVPVIVNAFNKTFTPFNTTFKDGYVEIQTTALDVDKKTMYFDIWNKHDSVYFVYKLDGAWAQHKPGYAWANLLPPQSHLKGRAEYALDPGSNLPRFKAEAGVTWSKSMNILALVMDGVDAIINAAIDAATDGMASVVGIQVSTSDKVMGFIKTIIVLQNAYDSVGSPNAGLDSLSVYGVEITKEDFHDLAKKGLDEQFWEGLKEDGLTLDRAETFLKAMLTSKKMWIVYGKILLSFVGDGMDQLGLSGVGGEEQSGLVDNLEAIHSASEREAAAATQVLEQEKVFGERTESVSAVFGAVVTSITFSLDWVLTNAVVAGTEEKVIEVHDPPGSFYPNITTQTVYYLGGIGGEINNGSAHMDIDIKKNMLVVDAIYIINNSNKLSNMDKFSMVYKGRREGNGMKGELNISLKPKDAFIVAYITAFRQPNYLKHLLKPYFTKLSYSNYSWSNATLYISAKGTLTGLANDKGFSTSLFLENGTIYAEIYREIQLKKSSKNHHGHRINVAFGPVFGVPLNSTSLNVSVERIENETITMEGVNKTYVRGKEIIYSFESAPPSIGINIEKKNVKVISHSKEESVKITSNPDKNIPIAFYVLGIALVVIIYYIFVRLRST